MGCVANLTYEVMVGGVDTNGDHGGFGCRNYTSFSRICYDTMIAFAIGCISILSGCLLHNQSETKFKRDNCTTVFKHHERASLGGGNGMQKHRNSNTRKWWTCLALAYTICYIINLSYKWIRGTVIFMLNYCNLLTLVHLALLGARPYPTMHNFGRTILNTIMYQVLLPVVALWDMGDVTMGYSMGEATTYAIMHVFLIATPFLLVSQFEASQIEQYPLSLCWVLFGYGSVMFYSVTATIIAYVSTINIVYVLCPYEGMLFAGEYYRLHAMWILLLATAIIGPLYVSIVKLCDQLIMPHNNICAIKDK